MAHVLDRHRQKALSESRDFSISQPGVRLADVDEPARPRVLDRKRVIGQHALPLAVAPLDRSHDDVECRERPLQLQPCQAAPSWRVRTDWILDHQPLIATFSRLGKDAVEVLRVGRLLEPRQQKRMLEAETF